MTDCLITLDLDGLCNQLNELEGGLSQLKAQLEQTNKKVVESDRQAGKLKDKQADQFMGIRQKIGEIEEQLAKSEQNMREMDGLVVKIKESMAGQESKENSQKQFNRQIDARVVDQKMLFEKYCRETDEVINKMTLQSDFDRCTDALRERVGQLEQSNASFNSQVEKIDLQLQELIDRVETIEIHGVEPKKAQNSIVQKISTKVKDKAEVKIKSEPRDSLERVRSSSTQNRDEQSKESDPISEEPGDQVEEQEQEAVEEAYQADQELVKEIKQFARSTLDENETQTWDQLFDKTVKHFESLRLKEKTKELRVAPDHHEYGPEQKPSTPTKPKTLLYECHLPTQIHRVFDGHLKKVYNHVVWLETLKPKFEMEDGRLQLGSDYEQVFAHVQVQTFQQEQLLKQQLQDSLAIGELRKEIAELKVQAQDESRRVSKLEQGQEIDLSHLQVDGAGLKELFKWVADMKTDILQKTVSNEDIRNLRKDFQALKEQQLPAAGGADFKLREDITLALGQMHKFTSQLTSLQIQLMKSETLCFDVDRECKTLVQRLEAVESQADKFADQLPQLTGSEAEEQLQKMRDFAAIKHFCQSQFVGREQFKAFTEMTNTNLNVVDSLSRTTLENKQKILDNSKLFRENNQKLAKVMNRSESMQQQLQQMLEKQQKKVDYEIFDEELGYLKYEIKNFGKPKKAGDDKQASSNIAARQPQSGGLPPQLRSVLREMQEMLTKSDTQVKSLAEQLQGQDVAALQQQVAEFQQLLAVSLTRESYDREQQKVIQDIMMTKMQMKLQQDFNAKFQQHVQKKLEDYSHESNEKDQHFVNFEQMISKCEEQINALKRNQGATNKKGGLKQLRDSPQKQDANAGSSDEEGAGVQKLKDDLRSLQKSVRLKQEQYDYKLRMLWPLVDPDSKGKSKSELEDRLSDKILQMSSKHQDETSKLRNEIDELRRAFDEKIRRQALVQNKRQQNEDGANEQKNIKRQKFLATQMTRDLMMHGRLPQFESYGDHIARYGKGFSQILSIAQEPTGQIISPKLVGGVSLGELSNSYDYDGQHVEQPMGTLLTSPVTFQDTISQQSNRKSHRKYPNSSHKEIQIILDQPTIDANLNSRVHPSTKGLVFKTKVVEDIRQNNQTQVHQVVEQQVQTQFLPLISTSRSVSQALHGDNEQ